MRVSIPHQKIQCHLEIHLDRFHITHKFCFIKIFIDKLKRLTLVFCIAVFKTRINEKNEKKHSDLRTVHVSETEAWPAENENTASM
jgi:hypothetical protein